MSRIDHALEAISRLPIQYRSRPGEEPTNDERLIRALVSGIQRLEDTIQDLLTKTDIDTAQGYWLDQIGKLVGQPRGGLSDDIYRRYVRARILVNRSDGTVNELLRIARLVISGSPGGTVTYTLRSEAIATVRLTIADESVDAVLGNAVFSLLRQATAGGVRLLVEYAREAGAAARYGSGIYGTDTYWTIRDV